MPEQHLMSLEGILLSGISAVTIALVFVWGLLWKQMQECKDDRKVLHSENKEQAKAIAKLEAEVGSLETYKEIIQNCQTTGCIFTARRQEK